MDEYIKKQDLIDWCNETYKKQTNIKGKEYVNAFLQAVIICPAADVVEVVRCKDCKHKNPVCYRCLRDNLWHDNNDFCSHGERKE